MHRQHAAAHPGITMDRFTFVPCAQPTDGQGFVSQLRIDSGAGAARHQRLFTFTPVFESADHALAYAVDQAGAWMQRKTLA